LLSAPLASVRNEESSDAEAYLERWYAWAIRSRLEPIQQFACSIREHWQGALHWFTSKVSNGIIEAIASLIQAAKRRPRGYRTTETSSPSPISSPGSSTSLPTRDSEEPDFLGEATIRFRLGFS
jgi:hypothetical protein